MKYEIAKIIIIFSVIMFINLARSCPTSFGYLLINQNKICYSDIARLDFNGLDFKSSGT